MHQQRCLGTSGQVCGCISCLLLMVCQPTTWWNRSEQMLNLTLADTWAFDTIYFSQDFVLSFGGTTRDITQHRMKPVCHPWYPWSHVLCGSDIANHIIKNHAVKQVQIFQIISFAQVLTQEQKDLLMKIMSDLAELNMTVKDLGALDLEQLLSGKLGERSAFGLPAREKSPCKNFFWKTFSAC